MTKILDNQLLQSITIGAITGGRTSMGPALMSAAISNENANPSNNSFINFFKNSNTSISLGLMSIPELIIDKLPGTGNRIDMGGLIVRAATGAFCGGTIYYSHKRSFLQGMFIGGLTAVASAFTLFYIRKNIVAKTNIPDQYIGALEDLLLITSGASLFIFNKSKPKIL